MGGNVVCDEEQDILPRIEIGDRNLPSTLRGWDEALIGPKISECVVYLVSPQEPFDIPNDA